MNKKSLIFATAALTLGSSPLLAQDTIISELDASIRLGLGLDSEPETDLSFRNWGSRLRWNGAADIPNSNTAVISYLEFGFDQDDGVSGTRQGWVGAQGDFGTVKGGKQYRAFYDAVSSITDIAWWNSCFYAIGCSRQSSVVKYSNDLLVEGGDLMGSATLEPGDVNDDVLDQLDLGGRFAIGNGMTVGAAISIGSEDTDGPDVDVIDPVTGVVISSGPSDAESGLALGVGATTTINDMDIGAIFEYASDDYIGGEDDGFLIEGAVTRGPTYGVVGIADDGGTPFFLTLGYMKTLIEDRALMYFEAGVDDPDTEDTDLNVSARAVLVFNFDVFSTEIAQ